jgi:predicted transcriptional regulator
MKKKDKCSGGKTYDGGMYEILGVACNLIKTTKKEQFTTKQISEITGISRTAVCKNLSRLVKARLIIRTEYMEKITGARTVMYQVNGEYIDFICKYLYR